MAAVFAVRNPFDQLFRIKRGLRGLGDGEKHAGGLTGNGIGGLRIGHVIVHREPEAGAAAGTHAARSDARFIEMPLGCF